MPPWPHCPHCRSIEAAREFGSDFRCGRCSLFFTHAGEPLRPTACLRCGSGRLSWCDDRYDCAACGRRSYGPFPTEPRTRMTPPEGGFVANSPGGIAGRPAHLAVT